MKKKPFIIITGDDSVRAEGIILLKRIVEKFADYQIVATKEQQSGVGAKCSFNKEIKYGTEIIDKNHKAYWVDGTPTDAVLFSRFYFKKKPDLLISGLNMGENVSEELIISGTCCAAIIASDLGIPAIAFSLETNRNNWFKNHTGTFNSKLLDYPGKLINKIINYALKFKFSDFTFWNVNFPTKKTEKIRVVRTSSKTYYHRDIEINKNTFRWKAIIKNNYSNSIEDTSMLHKGYATITPCKMQFTDIKNLYKLKF